MTYPSYAVITERTEPRYSHKAELETQTFKVFLDGNKMDIGFKVDRLLWFEKGLRKTSYRFTRYGWSTGMLKWRGKELRQKLYYLENFFQEEKKDKIDNFLLKDRKVLIEKTYKRTEAPLPLIAFNR